MTRRLPLVVLAVLLAVSCPPVCAAEPIAEFAKQLKPFVECMNGTTTRFVIDGRIVVGDEAGSFRVHRAGADRFEFEAEFKEYSVRLSRTPDGTRMDLPHCTTTLLSEGSDVSDDHLAPAGLMSRVISSNSMLAYFWGALSRADENTSAALVISTLKLTINDEGVWESDRFEGLTLHAFTDRQGKPRIAVESDDFELMLVLGGNGVNDGFDTTGYKTRRVNRAEMERLIARALRRASEIAAPGPTLRHPVKENRDVPHGKLRWVDGHRVVLLAGTPQQIGKAHGQLLGREAKLCVESTLHTIGLVDTIRTGKWFPDRLREAHGRLQKHIPADHLAETDALADAIGISQETARLTNVFPELFHCSGFAVFGSATEGGVLYHGRVLDYMTHIGLQDAATTFIIAPEGKIPFVSVGYAGFVGTVTGMNARQISLGEMGGRGEGQWDGVPMATLMRRALEECTTLDEVKRLWADSPRTCEYYYVFADGKVPSAVGVAATPTKIEFMNPGEGHALLGEGIEDAVVLSAGDRLKTLRRRVIGVHGSIDEDAAVRLMDRPVAMNSNLHNALMVPQKLRILVANATHDRPAAERPYVTIDLAAWLKRLPTGK